MHGGDGQGDEVIDDVRGGAAGETALFVIIAEEDAGDDVVREVAKLVDQGVTTDGEGFPIEVD